MKPLPAALTSVCLTTLLFSAAWLFLLPGYDTNDDVAIRLFLEGRIFPGAQPSGYAYFVNLALGQAIASLYRFAPGISWYDVFEQGTLALTTGVALYCCLRIARHFDQAVAIALIAATMLAIMGAIQFTIVGALGAVVGTTALTFALAPGRPRLECVILSGAGAALLVIGALFRLEAALLGILVVILAGWPLLLGALRHAVRARRSVVIFSSVAFGGIALAWAYHFAEYLRSPDWREFYQFNLLRAQLTEYATERIPSDILNHAFGAAGWTNAEYQMLNEWVFFDARVFSTENLRRVAAELPLLSGATVLDILSLLVAYCLKFPFFLFGICGVVLTASRPKDLVVASLSFAAVIGLVILISVLVKPLAYRVFWPIAVGTMFVLWVALHARPEPQPHWIQRAITIALLLAASVMVVVQTIDRSRADQRARQLALVDLTQMPTTAGRLVVIIGSAFPFERLERPFSAPYFQRDIEALAVGTTLRAPPIVEFVSRVASPDIPSWLCSDRVLIAAQVRGLSALEAYYERYRGQAVSFTRVFDGKSIILYQCNITK